MENASKFASILRLSTGGALNNLPMPTAEVYHEWWEFDTDTFPPLSLLTFPHHGGILSWWECAGKPSSSPSSPGAWSWSQDDHLASDNSRFPLGNVGWLFQDLEARWWHYKLGNQHEIWIRGRKKTQFLSFRPSLPRLIEPLKWMALDSLLKTCVNLSSHSSVGFGKIQRISHFQIMPMTTIMRNILTRWVTIGHWSW